jgi:hypothetical protein
VVSEVHTVCGAHRRNNNIPNVCSTKHQPRGAELCPGKEGDGCRRKFISIFTKRDARVRVLLFSEGGWAHLGEGRSCASPASTPVDRIAPVPWRIFLPTCSGIVWETPNYDDESDVSARSFLSNAEFSDCSMGTWGRKGGKVRTASCARRLAPSNPRGLWCMSDLPGADVCISIHSAFSGKCDGDSLCLDAETDQVAVCAAALCPRAAERERWAAWPCMRHHDEDAASLEEAGSAGVSSIPASHTGEGSQMTLAPSPPK